MFDFELKAFDGEIFNNVIYFTASVLWMKSRVKHTTLVCSWYVDVTERKSFKCFIAALKTNRTVVF